MSPNAASFVIQTYERIAKEPPAATRRNVDSFGNRISSRNAGRKQVAANPIAVLSGIQTNGHFASQKQSQAERSGVHP
jgi:hypothetical protein